MNYCTECSSSNTTTLQYVVGLVKRGSGIPTVLGRRSSTRLEVASDLRWAAISYIPAKIITPTSMVEKLEKS
jgi:hypothetical protein